MKTGRPARKYFKEIQEMMDMAAGEVVTFQVRHPWGLAKKLYRVLHQWDSKKYHKLKVDYKKKTVTVQKQSVPRFIYDEYM